MPGEDAQHYLRKNMLQPIEEKKVEGKGHRFAIVASKYNSVYVDSMVEAARKVLEKAGAESVEIIRVPGAFEIPVVAARLARQKELAAIICLGIIFRGATSHAQHIGEAVSNALAMLQIEKLVPIVHGVLLLENEQQAQKRCLESQHNRGTEAAQTALEMARLLADWKLPAARATR